MFGNPDVVMGKVDLNGVGSNDADSKHVKLKGGDSDTQKLGRQQEVSYPTTLFKLRIRFKKSTISPWHHRQQMTVTVSMHLLSVLAMERMSQLYLQASHPGV